MEGISLLCVFIGISMLIRWLVVHDKAPNEKTHGLFAMREPGHAQENQTLLASRSDPGGTPKPTHPVISISPPSRKQR